MNPIIIIPARLASTRLPRKPLADIGGRPMIARVAERALAAGIGPVAVAVDSAEIAQALEGSGARAVVTRGDHQSGSDRVFEALETLDPEGRHDVVVNVQGDFPTAAPAAIAAVLGPLKDAEVAIGTLAGEIVLPEERTNPNVVKLIGSPVEAGRLRALYFTRATAPSGPGPVFHHIGIYAYRRAALERFAALPPSPLEQRERLEQLRALEAGMSIGVALVDTVPLGVDTPHDLARARAMFEAAGQAAPT
jgi:3-deoxy-manno-octulosonate cytidylyltransferase (CMP-KDO synthetase)